jgi:hypothetical protein
MITWAPSRALTSTNLRQLILAALAHAPPRVRHLAIRSMSPIKDLLLRLKIEVPQ